MRNYTYKVLTPPVNQLLSLVQIKNYLRLDADDTSDDDLLNSFLSSAIGYVQKYTNRTLLTTKYITYRDNFIVGYGNYIYELHYWELRRSPLQTIDSIEYYNTSNVLTDVDNKIYYNTLENDYSKVLLNYGESFPTDNNQKLQCIEITFYAGYGDTADDVPDDIIDAVLLIISSMYENRGDCSFSSCAGLVPCEAKGILSQYRILSI